MPVDIGPSNAGINALTDAASALIGDNDALTGNISASTIDVGASNDRPSTEPHFFGLLGSFF